MLLEQTTPSHTLQSRNARRIPLGSFRGLTSLTALARQAVELSQQSSQSEHDSIIPLSILKDLLSALSYRDENTFTHSRRVSMIAVGIARQLCWNVTAIKKLEIAALLHDIGKIGIPDHILFKPGTLTSDEANLMSLSTRIAENIMQVCQIAPDIRQTVVEAKMGYSGMEHPERPIGKELSQSSRILAVADAFESLSRQQVYRPAKTEEEIFDFFRERAGSEFDPRVLSTLERWLDTKGREQLSAVGLDQDIPWIQFDGSASLAINSLCNLFTHLYTLESSYDGFIIVDKEQKVLLANQGTHELFRIYDQQLVGKAWSRELLPQANTYEEQFAPGEYPLEQAWATQRPCSVEVKIPRDEHNWIIVEQQCIPLFGLDGNFEGVAEFYRSKNKDRKQSHQYRELALQASKDALTGVANRGELENQLSRIMKKFQQDPQGMTFSVIYLDIDHFKSINDTYGHATGDEVLVEMARLLREETYSSEFVARYGGEEFVIICPDLAASQAAGRAERFRLEIAKLRFNLAADLKITSSFGVSEVDASDSLESVLKRADEALYESKKNGRNRTTIKQRKDQIHDNPEKPAEKADPFLFESSIKGVLYDEFLVIKLKGLVTEQKAKILDVSEGKASIQFGQKNWLMKRWGKAFEQQPVSVEINTTESSRSGGRSLNSQMIELRIKPVGQPKNAEQFQYRARKTYRMIREHFLSGM